MAGSSKGWIGVDLDGTLAKYDTWKGYSHIGEPIPAMLDRVKRWVSEGKDVRIMTARAKSGDSAKEPIKTWLQKYVGKELPITSEKDQQMLELWDDRAIQLKTNTGQRVDGINKSYFSELEQFIKAEDKGGPYIGPKNGKWSNPEHTIPWKEPGDRESSLQDKIKRRGKGQGDRVALTKAELVSVLKNGTFGIVSAGKNPKLEPDMSQEAQVKRHEQLRADLKDQGYMFTELVGHYEGEEPSFLVMAHEIEKEDIKALGKKYNQDSVIHASKGQNEMHFTTGKNEGQYHKGQGYEEKPDATDYYSIVKHPDGSETKFALNFNWDELDKSLAYSISGIDALNDFTKSTIYYGPKQGRYKDPQHKISWKEDAKNYKESTKDFNRAQHKEAAKEHQKLADKIYDTAYSRYKKTEAHKRKSVITRDDLHSIMTPKEKDKAAYHKERSNYHKEMADPANRQTQVPVDLGARLDPELVKQKAKEREEQERRDKLEAEAQAAKKEVEFKEKQTDLFSNKGIKSMNPIAELNEFADEEMLKSYVAIRNAYEKKYGEGSWEKIKVSKEAKDSKAKAEKLPFGSKKKLGPEEKERYTNAKKKLAGDLGMPTTGWGLYGKTIVGAIKNKETEAKKSMNDIEELEEFIKGGPYIGPKGGKWADPEHKIAWKETVGKITPRDVDQARLDEDKTVLLREEDKHRKETLYPRPVIETKTHTPEEKKEISNAKQAYLAAHHEFMTKLSSGMNSITATGVKRQKKIAKLHKQLGPLKQKLIKLEDKWHDLAGISNPWKSQEAKKSINGIKELEEFIKGGGPYIGPRGGKWADPEHTIPWTDDKEDKSVLEKPQYDIDFKAGFKAGKKAHAKNPNASRTDANKAYGRVSKKHGSYYVEGFTAAIDHARGAYDTDNAKTAKKLGLDNTQTFSDKEKELAKKPLSWLRKQQDLVQEKMGKNYKEAMASEGGLKNPPKDLQDEMERLNTEAMNLNQAVAFKTKDSVKKSFDTIEAFIATTEATMSDLEKGTMPTGEAKLGTGEEQGGTLEGVGKVSGTNTSSGGAPIDASNPKSDKLSEDDAEDEKQMQEHKKPIETAKSFNTTPQGQRDMVARAHAAKVSQLRKGDSDVEVGVGIAPPAQTPEPLEKAHTWNQGPEARVIYSDSADKAVERLFKSDGFYEGSAPKLGNATPRLAQSVVCPACKTLMSKSLSACPTCGAGACEHKVMPGATIGGSELKKVSDRKAPLLQPKREKDLVLPNGYKPSDR